MKPSKNYADITLSPPFRPATAPLSAEAFVYFIVLHWIRIIVWK